MALHPSGDGRNLVDFKESSELLSREASDELPRKCVPSINDMEDATMLSTFASSTAAPDSVRGVVDTDMDEMGVSVICVGLMRTGLKTLHKALRNLGYCNIYDQEDIVSTYDLWDGVMHGRFEVEGASAFDKIFQGANVVMGMPIFCFWEQILEVYPNAKVILTVRDEDEWWSSVKHARTLMERDLPGAPLVYGSSMRRVERMLMPSTHKFNQCLRFAWATMLGASAGAVQNESLTRSNYRRHNMYVEKRLAEFRTRVGEPQLLVYDVRQGWGPLCRFLGKHVPEVDFPSVLKVPYFLGECGDRAMLRSEEDSSWASDAGQEFENLLRPDSDIGVIIRRELRRGVLTGVVGLTAFVGLVLAVHFTEVVKIPVAVVAFVYLAMMCAGWSAYVVVNHLVMRVPALVVLPMALKSLVIAGALNACLLSFGLLKEMLVTRDNIHPAVLVLSARGVSVVFGAVAAAASQGGIPRIGAPLRAMAAFVCTNEASTWVGYAMLGYVSFPIVVMAKSCTMLPNMVMGRILNGSNHGWGEYLQAVLALVCVGIMHLADEKSIDPAKIAAPAEVNSWSSLFIGGALLLVFFACDGFTSQWQTALYAKYPSLTQTQMMFGGNLIGLTLAILSCCLHHRHAVASLASVAASPEVLGRILGLGVCGALGQFCIYGAIRVLGPLSFTWMMTGRQLLSVLISLVFFGHGVSGIKLLCIITVFAIMISSQLQDVLPGRLSCPRSARSVSSKAMFRTSARLGRGYFWWKHIGLTASVSFLGSVHKFGMVEACVTLLGLWYSATFYL